MAVVYDRVPPRVVLSINNNHDPYRQAYLYGKGHRGQSSLIINHLQWYTEIDYKLDRLLWHTVNTGLAPMVRGI